MIEYPPDYISLDELMRCKPWIEASLETTRGTHNFDDLVQILHDKKAVLWPFDRSCAVTEIIAWPRFMQMHYWIVGGDLDELLTHEPGVTAWGREQGCTRFTTAGRLGWRKAMKSLGYEPLCETCYRDIPLD